MAVETSSEDLFKDIIDQYLQGACLCIKATAPDNGMLGYPAMLLLLSAVDAMGQSTDAASAPRFPASTNSTRLDVLTCDPFTPKLTDSQAKELAEWYRHPMAHRGTMATGAFLLPEGSGQPYIFDAKGSLVGVAMPEFYDVVKNAWDFVKTSVGLRPGHSNKKNPHPDPDPYARPPDLLAGVASFALAVSGVTGPVASPISTITMPASGATGTAVEPGSLDHSKDSV